MKEFKSTWLYIKQHNVTGLKYFGKTTKDNPTLYKGSGLYWLKHLKKHGTDISTMWLKKFDDLDSLREFAINFSVENNITESVEWANLKIENGSDGNPVGWIPPFKGKPSWNSGLFHSESTKSKISENNGRGMLNKSHRSDSKKLMSVLRVGKEPGNKGIARTDEQKENQSSKMIGKTPWNKGIPMSQVRCERCGKSTSVAALGRYHKTC